MSNAFCFVSRCPDNMLSNVARDFTVKLLNTGTLLLKRKAHFIKCCHEQYTAYLIGNIYNISMLRTILANSDGHIWTVNDAEVLCLLREKLGQSTISLAEGDFCLFIEYHSGMIEVITESRGLNNINIVKTDRYWITNSLKTVGYIIGERAFEFRPEKEVVDSLHRADNFSPIRNAIRLKPGTLTQILHDEQNHIYSESHSLMSPCTNKPLTLSEDRLYQLIDINLRSSISSCVDAHETVGIPLSGGLDSSLISLLACQQFKNVKTWSIGSESGNEFTFAKTVSDALNTEHEVKTLTDEEIISGIAEAIHHNEIFDGLSSEIQSGLFNIYKLASHKVTSLLTGYGADLLFGGILNPKKNHPNPNAILAEQIYRTKWTGEFSTHGAKEYGLNVYHPFWSNSMIALCQHLAPEFKIRNQQVKNVLREYAENLHSLPTEIIWRKKTGIHEGSAVNQVFARMIGTSLHNYQEKTRFCYTLYKAFLTGHLSLHELSAVQLISMFKRNLSWS